MNSEHKVNPIAVGDLKTKNQAFLSKNFIFGYFSLTNPLESLVSESSASRAKKKDVFPSKPPELYKSKKSRIICNETDENLWGILLQNSRQILSETNINSIKK